MFSRLLRWSWADAVPEAWVCCRQEDEHLLDWSQGCLACPLSPEYHRPRCRQGAMEEMRNRTMSYIEPCSLLPLVFFLNNNKKDFKCFKAAQRKAGGGGAGEWGVFAELGSGVCSLGMLSYAVAVRRVCLLFSTATGKNRAVFQQVVFPF